MVGDLLQPSHLLFVFIVALFVLGPKRLPEVGRSLGRGLRDFRDAMSGDDKPDLLPEHFAPEHSAADLIDPPVGAPHGAIIPAGPATDAVPPTMPAADHAPAHAPAPPVSPPATPAPAGHAPGESASRSD